MRREIYAMNEEMTTSRKAEAVELLSHYRPLALKAVLAACAIKSQAKEPSHVPEPDTFGHLPEGFHMPQGLDD
jgi:hypothetical protein